MAIIKIAPRGGFTVVNNAMAEDERISFKAKGVLLYLLGRPADWVVHVSHLATVGTDRRDSVYSAIDELIRAGYITRTQKRGKSGTFSEVEYTVHPEPQVGPECEPQPDTGFPDTGFPDTENPSLLKKENTKERSNKPPTPKIEPEPAAPEPETQKIVSVSDSTLGYNATAEDREKLSLPFEGKKQPLPQNQRMDIGEWAELWRQYIRKNWPAGQNQRAIHVLRYWTRQEIESAFATLPRADYPGWAYLRAIFENQASDQPQSGKDRDLELILSGKRTPKKKIDDISKFL